MADCYQMCVHGYSKFTCPHCPPTFVDPGGTENCRHGKLLGTCGICNPGRGIMPHDAILSVPPAPTFTPIGCICPPGANKECGNPVCPRKNHLTAATAKFEAADGTSFNGCKHMFVAATLDYGTHKVVLPVRCDHCGFLKIDETTTEEKS